MGGQEAKVEKLAAEARKADVIHRDPDELAARRNDGWHMWRLGFGLGISMDWFKGKSAGNHGFYH